MHCEEFSGLDGSGLYLLLGLLISYYASGVSYHWQGIGVDGLDLVPSIKLTLPDLTLWKYLAVADLLVASSWFPFTCWTPR